MTNTNPKDTIGSTKLPLHLWPAEATALGCLGMLEGASKYGRANFVSGDGVIASIYIDAAKRHLDAYFSGEDYDPDIIDEETGLPLSDHLGNALSNIAIVVKARAHGKLIDDRDYEQRPGRYREFVRVITPRVAMIKRYFSKFNPKHWTINDRT